MKQTDKDKPIHTIPKGVWEASHEEIAKEPKSSVSTDMQGNGYPEKPPGKRNAFWRFFCESG